jgi:hypothetical protein
MTQPPAVPVPAYSLYDDRSVWIATLFGSPAAGSILAGINYRRLGNPAAAAAMVAGGILVTAFLILLGFAVPGESSKVAPIVGLVAVASTIKALQGAQIARHVELGGTLASRWTAFGIGVATLVPLLAVITGVVMLQSWATKVTFGKNDEITIAGSATRQDAQPLGESLRSIGYFTDKGATVDLSKDKSGVTVSFMVQDGAWDKPEYIGSFWEIGHTVAPSIGGLPIKVRMINRAREAKREMTIAPSQKVLIGAKDAVYYSGSATEAQAKALGESLKTIGFLRDRGAMVEFSSGSEGTVIGIVVIKEVWKEPDMLKNFQDVIRGVAPSAGGLPIKLRFLNMAHETQKEVTVN